MGVVLEKYRGADDAHKVQLVGTAALSEEQRAEIRAVERRIVRHFSQVLRRINPDLDRPERPLLMPVTMSLFGMMNWVYMWFRDGGPHHPRGLCRGGDDADPRRASRRCADALHVAIDNTRHQHSHLQAASIHIDSLLPEQWVRARVFSTIVTSACPILDVLGFVHAFAGGQVFATMVSTSYWATSAPSCLVTWQSQRTSPCSAPERGLISLQVSRTPRVSPG